MAHDGPGITSIAPALLANAPGQYTCGGLHLLAAAARVPRAVSCGCCTSKSVVASAKVAP
jgi:hypothetical protein